LVLIDIVDKSQNQKMPQCDIFIIVKKILTLFPEQIEDILKNSEAKNTLFSIAFKENYFKVKLSRALIVLIIGRKV